MIKIAYIGLGWAVQNIWVPAFTAQREVEIVAGSDLSDEARRRFAKIIPARNIYKNPADVFAHSPDLCIIATPNIYHAQMAKLALSHHTNVLIEKPVCTNIREWREISELAIQKELKIFTSQAMRFRRDVSVLMDNLCFENVGQIRTVELEWVRARGIPNAASWFTDKDKSGGGAFFDLGWHLVDLCLYIIKPQTINFISGFASKDFLSDNNFEAVWKKEKNDEENELRPTVEDTATCYFYLNNICIKVKTAWASHRNKDSTRILISGSGGEVELQTLFGFSNNGPDSPVLTLRQKGEEKIIAIPCETKGIEYRRQSLKILEDLKTNSPVYENYQSILKIITLFEKFYESSVIQ